MLSHPCACYFLPQLTRSLICFYSYSFHACDFSLWLTFSNLLLPSLTAARATVYLGPLVLELVFITIHICACEFLPTHFSTHSFSTLLIPACTIFDFGPLFHEFVFTSLPSLRTICHPNSVFHKIVFSSYSLLCVNFQPDFSARFFHKLVCISTCPRTCHFLPWLTRFHSHPFLRFVTPIHSFTNLFSVPTHFVCAICHLNALFHKLVFTSTYLCVRLVILTHFFTNSFSPPLTPACATFYSDSSFYELGFTHTPRVLLL